MFLNIVTDEELLTSQIVKAMLLFVISAGIIYNLLRLVREQIKTKKIINAGILAILIVVIFLVFYEFCIEYALIKNPKYIEGKTIGYCSVFAQGEGIKFEYEINGNKFCNCNTFHPISKDSIVVPGGKYMVRYSSAFRNLGRMNFKMKTEE